MAARGHARHGSKHKARHVRCRDIRVTRLRSRHYEAGERRRFDARSHSRCAVLEAPFESAVEIPARLYPGGSKAQVACYNGRSQNKREMRRDAVAYQSANRRLLSEIIRSSEYASVEAPFTLGIGRSGK